MIVEINTDFLINNKITADQFLLLSLILADKQSTLKDYYLMNGVDVAQISGDIKTLHDKGFIEGFVIGTYDFNNLKATNFIKRLFVDTDFFKEFEFTYPLKVIRSDGTVDYLRTDKSKAKMLYLGYTKAKKSIHDHILKCLKQEILYRERNGTMKFMKRMTSWLNAQEWEAFEDQIDDLGELTYKDNDLGYGTELI
jgi:hypothetical protein